MSITILFLAGFLVWAFFDAIREQMRNTSGVMRQHQRQKRRQQQKEQELREMHQGGGPPPAGPTLPLALPPPVWPSRRSSQLAGCVGVARTPAADNAPATLFVAAQARVPDGQRVPRLVKEVTLMSTGADGTERPVSAVDAAWRRPRQNEFFYRSAELRASLEDYQSTQWQLVLQVPLALLQFPRRGTNSVVANIIWRDGESGRTLLNVRTPPSVVQVEAAGYLDLPAEGAGPA